MAPARGWAAKWFQFEVWGKAAIPGSPFTPMKLYVGQTQFPRRLEQYAKRFNFAEVRAEPHRLPKLSELNRVRKVLGPEFRFAVALPRSFSNLEWNAEAEKALSFAEKVCSTLGAEWLILQTQSSVFPSDRTRRRLGEWAARLAKPDRKLGWEPLGVWEPEEGDRWGAELGFHFVTDMSRQPSPPAAVRYARIRSLGEATKLRPYALEVLAENLEACEDATVAFEGEDASRAALSLREILGEHSAQGDADDLDEDFEEGDEDEAFEDDEADGLGETETEGD